jgi:hypothetical protein
MMHSVRAFLLPWDANTCLISHVEIYQVTIKLVQIQLHTVNLVMLSNFEVKAMNSIQG